MQTNEFKTFLKANLGNPIRVYTLKSNKNILRATFATLTRNIGELVLQISVVQYNSENGVIDFINTDHDSEVSVETTTMAAFLTAQEERIRDQNALLAAETTETITQAPVQETPVATTAPSAPKSKKAPKSAPAPVPAPAKKGKGPKVPAPTATPRVEKKAPPVAEKKAAPEKKAPSSPRKPAGEFRWTEKRVLIVKALRALKANGELNARNGEDVLAKAGEEITLQDVKHYLYKDNDLVTNGFTGCIKGLEGVKGVGYYLTEKGMKADLTLPVPPTA
jgi:hypothetical protein